MKKYTIKPNKKQIQIMKAYWKKFRVLEHEFYRNLFNLENNLEIESGIKGIEFFMCDNEYVGIGNVDRTMKLIQSDKLK